MKIFDGKTTISIITDKFYENEALHNSLLRAVNDLRQDVAMVSGAIDYKHISSLFSDSSARVAERLKEAKAAPALLHEGEGIIVGTVSDSAIIKKLMHEGKLPEAKQIENKWETYVIKEVDNSLVIAGSDLRGAIYGIYHISEEIGVSPWYWFSDVSVNVKDEIEVDYSKPYISKEPSVKYRGIFINDEERLIDWAKIKFPLEKAPGVNLYRRVFELLLRLKANTLWPAMHPGTEAFNSAKDESGIPINAREASLYGIVMASSHCEMMLRCNVSEWEEFVKNHYGEYNWQDNCSFDYTQNKEAILGYWKERLETNKSFESILALGIRGIHDGNAETKDLSLYDNSLVNMMADVIKEQRKLIKEVYGAEDAAAQVFIPYKGMADIYNDGLKDFIPEDVMLMWAEDNYGNLRQTPTKKEAMRQGGCGVYYHSSYWSWFSPKSYLWLNSTQLFYMAHQMKRAYECNSRAYWILNVGDIKPGDIVTELFLKMAWDINAGNDIEEYLISHAMRDFHINRQSAKKVASLATEFYHLCGIKKAEFFGHENPSDVNNPYFSREMLFPFNDNEGTWLVEKTNRMAHEATDIYNALPPADRDAFYEQLYYHILSYRDVSEEYVYLWKNNLAAKEGSLKCAFYYKELSQRAKERIIHEQEKYWACNNNKWTRVIHYDHPASYFNMNEGVLLVHDDKYMTPDDTDAPIPDEAFPKGLIVLDCTDFAESIKGADNAYWAVEKDAGRIGDAMTALPFSAEKEVDITTSARLRYRVHFEKSGTFNGKLYRIPTLNEGKCDDGSEKSCHLAIGIDDNAPVILSGNRSVGGTWKQNIMHMIEDIDFEITVSTPGWHDLYVYRVDAGIIFDKIVINTSSSPMPDSLFGFPIK
ncbi:MAG: glycosyl hydrolase 115 family protein [Clostridia bacterium]|nr:glycosyl hydrolase 115 family protein [Clostridia bacterium]